MIGLSCGINSVAFASGAGAPLSAPSTIVAPTISGTGQQDTEHSITQSGVYAGNPTPTVTTYWQIDSTDESGTQDVTDFTPPDDAGEVGLNLRLRVHASNSQGSIDVYSDPIVLTAAATDTYANPMPLTSSMLARTHSIGRPWADHMEAISIAHGGSMLDMVMSQPGQNADTAWNGGAGVVQNGWNSVTDLANADIMILMEAAGGTPTTAQNNLDYGGRAALLAHFAYGASVGVTQHVLSGWAAGNYGIVSDAQWRADSLSLIAEWEALVDYLNANKPGADPTIYLLPIGHLIVRIYDECQPGGDLYGLHTFDEFYSDDIHNTDLGGWAIAYLAWTVCLRRPITAVDLTLETDEHDYITNSVPQATADALIPIITNVAETVSRTGLTGGIIQGNSALNLMYPSDFYTAQPFIDVTRQGRPWLDQAYSAWSGPQNANGYPTAMNGATTIRMMILTDIPAAATSLNGGYTLTWEGSRPTWCRVPIPSPSTTRQARVPSKSRSPIPAQPRSPT